MAFVVLGLILAGLKFAEFGPVAQWSWWWVVSPFGLAVVWWTLSDSLGLTQRRVMRKLDERKEQRRQRQMEALGQGPNGRRGSRRRGE